MTSPKLDDIDPIEVTAEVVTEIQKHLAVEGLTDQQVTAVLSAWNTVKEGDELGTVRRDDVTGAVAHRVDASGAHLWVVTAPDGGTWKDTQSTLPWTQIYPVLAQ